jgi:hypothetical protein
MEAVQTFSLNCDHFNVSFSSDNQFLVILTAYPTCVEIFDLHDYK